MGSIILPVETETGGEGHTILQCNGCEIRQLQYPPQLPSNTDTDNTKVLIVLVHRQYQRHRRLFSFFIETVTDSVQYTFVNRMSKEQMHGYGTCATG